MMQIKLTGIYTNGRVVLIDDECFDLVGFHKWNISTNGYATRCTRLAGNPKIVHISMHRLLMNAPKGTMVDHINHNKLDNRLSNLRFCTCSQNGANGTKKPNLSSVYRGVFFDKRYGKWQAKIGVNRSYVYLGMYRLEVDAAIAYNIASVKYFGEFAYINTVGAV